MASGCGFGQGPFGHTPFGGTNWAYQVLYKELPQRMQDEDQASGSLYKKFVLAAAVPINTIRKRINTFSGISDPVTMRLDLLNYYAASFGLTIDTAEAEGFQRSSADFYAEFVKIKGTANSFVVLAKIHGFACTVEELWYDCASGTEVTAPTPVVGEVVGTVP